MKTASIEKLHNQRLVIADDDYLVLATLSAGLRDAGFEVFEALSGEEAISLCKDKEPELVILDINMPGMSGLEAAETIQSLNIAILFLSALDEKDIVETAITKGALGYLVKPIDINQIIPAIDTALMRAADIQSLHNKEKNLTTALHNGRETSIAIGILMAHSNQTAHEAELTLRQYSRNKRLKMSNVAENIIHQSESLNNLIKEITQG
jgi:response regulator NasT